MRANISPVRFSQNLTGLQCLLPSSQPGARYTIFENGVRQVDRIFDSRLYLHWKGCLFYLKRGVAMSTTVAVRWKPDELIHAVSSLTPPELNEFMLRFDEWQMARLASADAQAAQIAESYRLLAQDRLRVAELLDKNREEGLTKNEEAELDTYIGEMDQRLEKVADQLLGVANRQQQQKARPAR
jgi:hypothetical protein